MPKSTKGGRRVLPLTPAEKAVYEVMQDIPLKAGDMLLLGPKSVEILSTEGMFQGVLPDKFVIPESEWRATNVKRRNSGSGRQR